MDPVTDQDLLQDGLIENEDGSVDVFGLDPVAEGEDGSTDFLANLADGTIDEAVLATLATDLIEAIDRDRQARTRRDKQYEEGLRRTGLGDDAPGGAAFEGASTVVHPVLAEACVEFEARAIKELFPPQGPVKTQIIGVQDDTTLDRAERKRTFLNWQLTTQMQEYRSELEQLLTQLPLGGSQFQKFWQDNRFNRPTSEFVPIDDMLIPYAATSFYTAERVTHVQHITSHDFRQRVKSGLYVEGVSESADGYSGEKSASLEANEKIEGKEEDAYNEDGLRDVYEVYCWQEFSDDTITGGELAPYIITVDAYSQKILGVFRNWEEGDDELKKLDWIVEWKFIPWRGAYAIGFPQLIGSLSAAATGALRALLDSALINNMPSLVKLKGDQTSGQNITVEATGISEIKAPAGVDDIRKLLMPMPYNQPSPILFQLLGWLTDAAKDVVRTADNAMANAGDRTPVGTTQAMIEQGSMVYSAIHARLHESQKRALQILCRINKANLQEEEEVEELGKLIIRRQDFATSSDIIPVSDPAIFSESQRFAQNQSLQQMQATDAQDPSIPWNKIAIRRRMLKLMRIDNIDEVLPLPPKPVTSDALSELMALQTGAQLKAGLQQNHMAHIHSHLGYLALPSVLDNQLVPAQMLMALAGHIQEHLSMLYQTMVMQTVQAAGGASLGNELDNAVAEITRAVATKYETTVAPIIATLSEAQQKLQTRMPPQQMPPEVQASIQIAKMDIDRKAALDKATLEQKATEQRATQAREAAIMQMDGLQAKFDQWLEQQRLSLDKQNAELTARVALMNNSSDNQQKQMTELLKNRDDNDTKFRLAMEEGMRDMQKHMRELQATSQQPSQESSNKQPTADLTPHINQMQTLLDQINRSKTDDALSTVVQGLQHTIQLMSQPRRTVLEHDENGSPIGAVSTIAS